MMRVERSDASFVHSDASVAENGTATSRAGCDSAEIWALVMSTTPLRTVPRSVVDALARQVHERLLQASLAAA